jgi:hypothetical protein
MDMGEGRKGGGDDERGKISEHGLGKMGRIGRHRFKVQVGKTAGTGVGRGFPKWWVKERGRPGRESSDSPSNPRERLTCASVPMDPPLREARGVGSDSFGGLVRRLNRWIVSAHGTPSPDFHRF